MANDRALGGAILGGSILGVIVYGLLLYYFPKAILELTAFVAVVVLLGILAWIGWTMATTSPPQPMPETNAGGKPTEGEAGKPSSAPQRAS